MKISLCVCVRERERVITTKWQNTKHSIFLTVYVGKIVVVISHHMHNPNVASATSYSLNYVICDAMDKYSPNIQVHDGTVYCNCVTSKKQLCASCIM